MEYVGPRWDAARAGLKIFESDKPCKYGHIGPRRVDSGACVLCSKAKYASIKKVLTGGGRIWSPASIPIPMEGPIEPTTLRAMNSVMPAFAPGVLRAATAALEGKCDMALLERNVVFAVLLTKRGKTPEQIAAALTLAYNAQGAA